MPSLLIKDVEHGIGITKSALPVQMDGSSTPTKCVLQYLINVDLMLKMVIAPNVIKDMT